MNFVPFDIKRVLNKEVYRNKPKAVVNFAEKCRACKEKSEQYYTNIENVKKILRNDLQIITRSAIVNKDFELTDDKLLQEETKVKRKNSGSTKIAIAATAAVVVLVGVSVLSLYSLVSGKEDKQLTLAVNSESEHREKTKLISELESDNEEYVIATEKENINLNVTNEIQTTAAVMQTLQLAGELKVVDSVVLEETSEQATSAQTAEEPAVQIMEAETAAQESVIENFVPQEYETEEMTEAYEESSYAEVVEETTYSDGEWVYDYDLDEWVYIYNDGTTSKDTDQQQTTEDSYVEDPTEEMTEEETTQEVYEEETTAYEEETTAYEEETTAYEEETTAYEEETTAYEEETTAYEEETTEDTSYDNSLGQQIVDYAMSWVGVTPYVSAENRWTGNGYYNSLTDGTDCSGFTYLIYGAFGIYVPTGSDAYQYSVGTQISYDQLQPGDIVVYRYGGHVAIYAGNDMIIHCANPSAGTIYGSMWYSTPTAYVRVIG